MTSTQDAVARRREQLIGIHETLEEAVADLANSEAWQHMLRIAARMPHYSFNNILLVAVQRPDATAVAGYRAWAALGRQVRRGEKGIGILAPCLYRSEPGGEAAEQAEEPARTLRGFRVVHVFDITQTDGPALPDLPQLLRGEAPNGVWDRLAELVADAGFTLERGPCGQANGYTDFKRRVVRVRVDVDDAQAVKTLAHELGHIRADHEHRFLVGRSGSAECRGQAEVEAESIAYVVLTAAGADTARYSVPYITGWGIGSPEVLRASAEHVMRSAAAIVDAVMTATATADTRMEPEQALHLGRNSCATATREKVHRHVR